MERCAVIALGESLLRLSAPAYGRLQRIEALEVHVGGAEMNTLIGVAALGGQATWVTRLADNPLGRRISAHSATYGIDLVIDWDKDARAPVYFVEHGLPPRPSEVLYDRSGTAMTRLRPDHFPWDDLVAGKNLAYTTGITCSLGRGPMQAVEAFLRSALAHGCRTAFDLNYRSRLWDWTQATNCLRNVLDLVTVLFAGASDLLHLFGLQSGDPVELARSVVREFRPEVVVLRDTSSIRDRVVQVSVAAVTESEVATSQVREACVVDSFGAGDAATAAFLVAWLGDAGLQAACDDGAWASAYQHTFPGDAWQIRSGDLDGRHESLRSILR